MDMTQSRGIATEGHRASTERESAEDTVEELQADFLKIDFP